MVCYIVQYVDMVSQNAPVPHHSLHIYVQLCFGWQMEQQLPVLLCLPVQIRLLFVLQSAQMSIAVLLPVTTACSSLSCVIMVPVRNTFA